MPRLVGRQSNDGAIASLLIIALVAAFSVLEYYGMTDVIPDFGRDRQSMNDVG